MYLCYLVQDEWSPRVALAGVSSSLSKACNISISSSVDTSTSTDDMAIRLFQRHSPAQRKASLYIFSFLLLLSNQSWHLLLLITLKDEISESNKTLLVIISMQCYSICRRALNMSITSTSTSWSLLGVEDCPCAVRPQPITVALDPMNFFIGGGRQT